jgi:lysophospholipase L1-like esterase
MAAMNGSVVSFRGHGRLIACCTAVALMLAAFVIAPAGASAQPAPAGPVYLALGDSISFGYSEQRFNENYPTESPARYEEGFDHYFNKDLGKSFKGITDVNLACPGETSNGLIGENELLGGKASTEPTSPPALYQGLGDWHPCAYHNVDGFPLHAGYGSLSQLEDAVSILTENNKITGKPNEVKAITLNIGSNDELAQIKQCEVEHGSEGESAVLACVSYSAVHITIPHILANIGDTLGVLDTYYHGPIILLGYYNPDTFILPSSDELQEGANAAVEAEILPHFANVTLANPFPVFNKDAGIKASVEKAAICKYTEMCNTNDPGGSVGDGDIHPTAKGYKELAKLVNAAYQANPAK